MNSIQGDGEVEIYVEEIAEILAINNNVTVYFKRNYFKYKYDSYRRIKIKYIK